MNTGASSVRMSSTPMRSTMPIPANSARRCTRSTMALRRELCRRQCLLEVGDEIVHVLDADRQPHEAVADAELRAHVGRDRGMGHDGRVLDEALDAAE